MSLLLCLANTMYKFFLLPAAASQEKNGVIPSPARGKPPGPRSAQFAYKVSRLIHLLRLIYGWVYAAFVVAVASPRRCRNPARQWEWLDWQ